MPVSTALLCLVLAVQDGDSLRVRCADAPPHSRPVAVRIHAIDAPEQGQAHGRRARQALRTMVYRRTVALRCVDTDHYGRRVCGVYLPGADGRPGRDVGLAMVKQGWAWWYRRYSAPMTRSERRRYEAAEEKARARRAGLWQDGERALAPWRWRQARPR